MKKIVRVCWATWWPAPYWTPRFNELSNLTNLDIDIVFLSWGSVLLGWKERVSNRKFKYSVIRKKADESGYYKIILRLPKPWELFKRKHDVLIMPYADMTCIIAALICILIRRPYILHSPNTINDERKGYFIYETLKKLLFRKASAIFATGKAQLQYSLQYCNDKEKIYVIGNPTWKPSRKYIRNSKEVEKEKGKLGIPNGVAILYVGRLSWEKGLWQLLEAVGELNKKKYKTSLILVGEGPQRQELNELADSYNIDVKFIRFLGNKELEQYYAAADIFVLPSKSEPWGLVVNEAMQARLPIVISDRVGCKEDLIIDGENGYVFSYGRADELEEVLEKLIRDERKRLEMGIKGSEIIKNQSIEKWSEVVNKTLQKIVNS